MKSSIKTILALTAAILTTTIPSCRSREIERPAKVKGVHAEWTRVYPDDSLGIFSSKGLYGYFHPSTGKVAIPALYDRAERFSEGLAAVELNGWLGFIDSAGNTAIVFHFPVRTSGDHQVCHEFHHGVCVVPGPGGGYGMIDKSGRWIIRPEYDKIESFGEYAIVYSPGVRMQVGHDGHVINPFLVECIRSLDFDDDDRYYDTDRLAYCMGGLWGMMDENGRPLTKNLYQYIEPVSADLFLAQLDDNDSSVILNSQGEIIK